MSEEKTNAMAIEYLEHYKNVKYGMMPEWVWNMAIKALGQEPKAGHWIPVDDKNDAFDCSECIAMVAKKTNYCPRCGAKMIEPQESEDKE